MLRHALKLTAPLFAAYWLVGLGYGLFAVRLGFGGWYPVVTAAYEALRAAGEEREQGDDEPDQRARMPPLRAPVLGEDRREHGRHDELDAREIDVGEDMGARCADGDARDPITPDEDAHDGLEAVRIESGRRRIRVGDGEGLVRQHRDHEELPPARAAKAVEHRDAVEEVARPDEEDHQETLSLVKEVGFDSAFMFKYSERPGTYAAKHLPDNVSEETKIARLNELIKLQTEVSAEQNKKDEGKVFTILIENFSKRSREQMMGRTEQNKAVVIDKGNHHIGEFMKVRITGSTSATLFGEEVKE